MEFKLTGRENTPRGDESNISRIFDMRNGETRRASGCLNDREETFAISAALMSFPGEMVSRTCENREDRPG